MQCLPATGFRQQLQRLAVDGAYDQQRIESACRPDAWQARGSRDGGSGDDRG
jgi:hypothetical protein